MKVYNLCCEHDHRFEGWFASEGDFACQAEQHLIECPVCGGNAVRRLPSAPRLNLGSGEPASQDDSAQLQTQWLALARHIIANTEDVGMDFAEEARRIHYKERTARGIRGIATPEQREELIEEGIDVMQLPIPDALKQPLQ